MIARTRLINECKKHVEQRINEIQAALQDADDSLANDTKSSAGDKYETSREMIQQDINRYQKQLVIANQDSMILEHIEIAKPTNHISTGSLVETSVGIYFISISIGVLKLDKSTIFVISPISPLGKVLLGNKVGDSICFNNKVQVVLSIE